MRPTLNDKEEYDLIKSVYFKDNKPLHEDLDPVERLDRMEARQRFDSKSSR